MSPRFRFLQSFLTTALLSAAGLLASEARAGTVTTVPGTSDPWLAGMPPGSTASSGDVAPDESPAEVTSVTLADGGVLRFSATGMVSYGGGAGDPPDGAGSFIQHGDQAENGISNVWVPPNALVGVFLDEDPPDVSPAPATLDFRPGGNVPGGLDYLSLAPELAQVFFIGDGLTGAGLVQSVEIPAGATRLFLGSMDGFGWFNNTGAFEVTVVLAPGTWTDLGFALSGINGFPQLVGEGSLAGGTLFSLTLSNARPAATTYFVLGLARIDVPFKGGVMVPALTPPNGLFAPLPTDAAGSLTLGGTWPPGIPPGVSIFVQHWIADPAGPFGFAASNAVQGTTP